MKRSPPQDILSTGARRRAFTLIEAVISTALLGMVVVAALATVGATARTRQVVVNATHGHALAQDLMSEILEQPYEDPDVPAGPKGREVGDDPVKRKAWDDVDDFDGWSKSPPESREQKGLAEFTGWSRSVVVEYVKPADPQAVSATDQGLKRITVSVTDPAGKTTVLRSLRSRAGVPDWPPEVETTYASGLSVDVKMQQSGLARLISGAPLLNQPDSSDINLFHNGDVELGAAGWEGFGSKVAEYNADVHGGKTSLLVWNRPINWMGAGQHVTDIIEKDETYSVEAWVVHESPLPEQFYFRLTFTISGFGDVWTTFGARVANPGTWTRLSATFIPTWSGTMVDARLEVETTNIIDPFLIDDAVLRKLP